MPYDIMDPRALRPHPEFARLFLPASPQEMTELKAGMAAGQRFPPLLLDSYGQVLAGVEHWQTALELGWDQISVIWAPEMSTSETRALIVAENIRSREIREEHLWRGMNNFFDMEPLRPPGGW